LERPYTRRAVRLVEIRLLEGPNVYRVEPAVKIEVALGRRRSWYGQRMPGRHAAVRLGATVSARRAPSVVADLTAWVRRLHRLSGAAAWLREEAGPGGRPRRSLPVTAHRTSEPGHWVVAFPWREEGRAREIAEAAWRLTERGADPRRTPVRSRRGSTRAGRSRSLARALARIAEASTQPPPWIRDAERRVPIVSITGTNGKSTTTRMISHILRSTGKHVGTTTSDGVLVDGELVEEGDWTGPRGAGKILSRPEVEVAVLETARGGILLSGVGYESNEASIVTNVSSDHLDLQGLHTLPELAEVKSVVALITRPDGLVVLNADDALVAATARRVRAPVCFFSLRPRSARIRRHLAAGGRAMVTEDGWLVEAVGDRRHRFARIDEVPATLLGLARHNVANALAAAGAARALGATRQEIGQALRDFRPTAEQAPGRMNLYRVGDRVVIVDFAHNEAGISVALDVADGIAGGRRGRRRATVTAIVGTAGDRPDDTLRGIGRIAARRADRVVIKETLKYLRGRSRESVIGEILAGVVEGGGERRAVSIYSSEPDAVRGELADGNAAGVLLLMCHEERDAVAEAVAEFGGRPLETSELGGLLRATRPGAAARAGAAG
jgi:cyanophycin synthetase